MTKQTTTTPDIKALRARAAALGCWLRKRGPDYHLINKKTGDTTGGSLKAIAAWIARLESGVPITFSTACGIPLWTHDPKTGRTYTHDPKIEGG